MYDPGFMRGSQRGRYSDTRTGFHLTFQPEDLFLGVHPVMLIDRSGAGDATANRLGMVLIAGCRDAQAARQLGFVPVHNVGAAIGMARGAGAQSIGYLLSPPYFPLVLRTDA